MGMMTGGKGADPTTSHGSYNGNVTVEGKPVEVRNGVAKVEGEPYFVSDNGAMVVNHKGQLIGRVENGQFVVVDADYMNKMAEAGYIK